MPAAVIAFPQQPISARCTNQPPVKQPNKVSRVREYLTPAEVEKLINAARRSGGRMANRDALLILEAARHGFRAAELIALRWDQFDFVAGTLHVQRVKAGSPSTHYLQGPELRALKAWRRQQGESSFVFTALGGKPMTTRTVHHVVAEAGRAAGIPFPVHPHCLRHACGYRLANEGRATRDIQGYLGHKNMRHTIGYTELGAMRFKGF
jgi:type 1 fimbriae regulatory protein FimB/type 1 fimbriae regulatory protein FimE